jgi:hypothetical protein
VPTLSGFLALEQCGKDAAECVHPSGDIGD